jgi:MraZ protein
MFRGNCQTRLDEKGRLKIPADFKREIDRTYNGQFYLTSFNGTVVKLYPMQEWEKFELTVKNGPGTYEEKEKFNEVSGFYGHSTEMDAQGRLTIPESHRNKFGLKGEVSVLGKMDHFEIRVAGEFAKAVDENPLTPTEMNHLLSPRS